MTITKEGILASFYTVNKAPIKHLRVYFSPKQTGSGDPSPSNVRPISGYIGLEVTRCEKNFFNSDIENGGFNSSTGEEIVNEKRLRSGFVFLKAGTYTISSSTSYMMVIVYIYDINKNYMSNELINVFNYMPYTFTINGDRYIRLIWRRSDNTKIINDSIDNLQIEFGTTSSNYKSYSSTTIPVDWSSEAGTLYGGYIDLITGELVKTYAIKSITGDEDWYMSNGISGVCAYRPTLISLSITSDGYITPICDKLNGAAKWATEINECTINNSGNFYFGAPEELSTKEAVNNWIKSIGGFEIVYPISPITYQLSPTQLSTLIGRNNIWSDADSVEVEYDLAESNDELYKRRNILLRSVPHIETESGNIINFQTDVIAPMKSAKINFSPIQGGSGTSSPTNVRPISGWTNLSLYHSGENLYVPNSNNKGYISKSGVITVDETSTYTDLIPVNLGDVYSFECTTVSVNGDTNRRIHGYNSSGTWVKQLTSGTTAANTVEYRKISATIPADISYIRVSFRNQDTNVRITKENIVTADWQTAAGTIYGGYADLTSGKLIETIQKKTYDGSSDEPWWIYSSGNYLGFGLIQNDMATSLRYHGLSNWLNASSMTDTHKYECWLGVNNKFIYIVGISDLLESITVENWCAYLSEHPLEIIIPLATPIEHTLIPQTLKTLKGTNNIWSNANGPVEIKYWTH